MNENKNDNDRAPAAIGKLAKEAGGCFPLQVCRSRAGYYIGTLDEGGLPFSRESREYWRKEGEAETALARGSWTQKPHP